MSIATALSLQNSVDYLGSILKMSWTRGVTAQQRRRYFRSTRFTERKEACSLLTLPQVLAKILTIQSLGGATSVAKYLKNDKFSLP